MSAKFIIERYYKEVNYLCDNVDFIFGNQEEAFTLFGCKNVDGLDASRFQAKVLITNGSESTIELGFGFVFNKS